MCSSSRNFLTASNNSPYGVPGHFVVSGNLTCRQYSIVYSDKFAFLVQQKILEPRWPPMSTMDLGMPEFFFKFSLFTSHYGFLKIK